MADEDDLSFYRESGLSDVLSATYDPENREVTLMAFERHGTVPPKLPVQVMDELCAWWKGVRERYLVNHLEGVTVRCEYGSPMARMWVEGFDTGIDYTAYEIAIVHPDTGTDIAAWPLNEFAHAVVPYEEWKEKMDGHLRVRFYCRRRGGPQRGFLNSNQEDKG